MTAAGRPYRGGAAEERAAGLGQGALQARGRGARVGATWDTCVPHRGTNLGSCVPTARVALPREVQCFWEPACGSSRVFKPRIGPGWQINKVLTSAQVAHPLGGAPGSTVPAAVDSAGFIAPTRAKMLTLASFLFVMAIALFTCLCCYRSCAVVNRPFCQDLPLSAEGALISFFKLKHQQSKIAQCLAQCLVHSKHSRNIIV